MSRLAQAALLRGGGRHLLRGARQRLRVQADVLECEAGRAPNKAFLEAEQTRSMRIKHTTY